MYKCELCGTQVLKGSARQTIIKYKPAQHPYRAKVALRIVRQGHRKKAEWIDDPGGFGRQIEREIAVCLDCKRKHSVE